MIGAYRKILDLLDRRERRSFWLLAGLSLAMGLVDMIGIASILPFLALVANPQVVDSSPMVARVAGVLGIDDPQQLLPILGGAVFVIVVSSLALRALTFYALTRFTRMRVLSLTTRLLARYMAQPYSWFLRRNSAHLGKSLLSEVAQVVSGPVAAAMRLMAHGVVAILIIALLLVVEPVAAIGAALGLGGSYALIFSYFQKPLARMGEQRVRANQERFQVAQEAMAGIKEVKLLDLADQYQARFRRPSWRLADVQARLSLISETPRHILEAIAFGGMVLFVLWLLLTREGRVEEVLPVLGAFAFAGLRLFPSLQEIFRAVTRLRFGAPALASLHAELTAPLPSVPEAVGVEPVALRRRLSIRDVVYTYPGASRRSLDGLTLDIEARTTVGLVGATGAGKTTAVDVILGLLTPQSGRLIADGTPITPQNLKGWRQSLGYVPQTIYLTDDTLAANIAFGLDRKAIDMAAVERAARVAELHDFVMTLPDGYRTVVGERGARLSGGQRQRVGIARALYRDPDMLIFDEATSALDNLTERAVMDAIAALGHSKTIVLIAHRLSTVRACDRIFLLEDGRVSASGVYDELVAESAAFREIHQAAQ